MKASLATALASKVTAAGVVGDDGDDDVSVFSDGGGSVSGSILVSNMGAFAVNAATATTSGALSRGVTASFAGTSVVSTVSLQSRPSNPPTVADGLAFRSSSSSQLALNETVSEFLVGLSCVLNISVQVLVRWMRHHYAAGTTSPQTPPFATLSLRPAVRVRDEFLRLVPKVGEEEVEVCGLRNRGQTCFMNSVVQALASLPPVMTYLEDIALEQHRRRSLRNATARLVRRRPIHAVPEDTFWEEDHDRSSSSEDEPSLTEMLLVLLSTVGAASSRYRVETSNASVEMDPERLLRKVASQHDQFNGECRDEAFSGCGFMQQDAEEFLQALMNSVVSEAERFASTNDHVHDSLSELTNLLSGADDRTIDSLSTTLDDNVSELGDDDHHQDAAPLSFGSLLKRMDEEQKKMLSSGREPPPSTSLEFVDKEEKKEEVDPSCDQELSPTPTLTQPQQQQQQHTTASMRMLHSLSFTTPSPLSGWVGSLLQCTRCRHVRPIQNAPFLDIPVVPTATSSSSGEARCTLEQCLSSFTRMERVQDVECRECARRDLLDKLEEDAEMLTRGIETLRGSRKSSENDDNDDAVDGLRDQLTENRRQYHEVVRSDPDDDPVNDDPAAEPAPPAPRTVANKCLMLTRLPSVLCLHVQRRFYDPRADRMVKCATRVDFPETLDLASHCAHAGGGDDAVRYRLMSAVEHQGNAFGGHYRTFRRVGVLDRWALASDELVDRVDWNVVRRCQAYMLFYEAV